MINLIHLLEKRHGALPDNLKGYLIEAPGLYEFFPAGTESECEAFFKESVFNGDLNHGETIKLYEVYDLGDPDDYTREQDKDLLAKYTKAM